MFHEMFRLAFFSSHPLFSVPWPAPCPSFLPARSLASSLSRSSSNAPRNEKRFVKNVSASSQRRGLCLSLLPSSPFVLSSFPCVCVYVCVCVRRVARVFLERDQMNSDALEPCIESGVRFAADEGNCRAARRVPLNFSNLSKRERERERESGS